MTNQKPSCFHGRAHESTKDHMKGTRNYVAGGNDRMKNLRKHRKGKETFTSGKRGIWLESPNLFLRSARGEDITLFIKKLNKLS